MLLLRTTATALEAHCHVLAAGPGRPALVVDPGAGAAGPVRDLLARHALTVGAVMLTHGHADHVWDAAAVAGDAPVHIADRDRDRLEDPAAALGAPLDTYFRELAGTVWTRPTHVEGYPKACLSEGGGEVVPGVSVRVVPAPGHTGGSAVLLVRGVVDPGLLPPTAEVAADGSVLLCLCGDVIFAGSMGRTDLPGGDEAEMTATLRTLVRALPPETVLVPGHGPATTLAAERVVNPYLRQAL